MYHTIMSRLRWAWAIFDLVVMAFCVFYGDYAWAVLFGSFSAYYAWRKDSFAGYGG